MCWAGDTPVHAEALPAAGGPLSIHFPPHMGTAFKCLRDDPAEKKKNNATVESRDTR